MQDNHSDNKRIAKNTFYLYVRSVLMLAITLYTSRVTLQILGIEDFGVYNLVGGVVAMFSFLQTTMSSASQRFITYALGENDFSKLKSVFQTSITLHLSLAFFVAILIEVLGYWFIEYKLNIPEARVDAAKWVLHFSAITTFLRVICVPYDALIVAHEKMSAFAYIGIFEAFSKLTIVMMLLLFKFDRLITFAFLTFCVNLLLRAIYTIYSRRNFEESKNVKYKIEKSLFKEMFAFAGWNLIGNGSYVLRNQGISLLLNIYFGVVVNAANGICDQVQHGVMLFVRNFQSAVNPQLTKSIASNDYHRAHTLILQGSRFSFYLLSFFSIPLILCTGEILSLWLGKVPEWSEMLIKFTLIYFLFDVLSRFHINSILAYGNIRNYQIIVGGIKLFALPLAWTILALGGSPITGVIVNIFLEVICLVLRLWYNKIRLDFPVNKFIFSSLLCWTVFLLSLVVSYLFKYFVTDKLLVSLPVSILILGIVIYTLGLKKSEKKKLHVYLLNFYRK